MLAYEFFVILSMQTIEVEKTVHFVAIMFFFRAVWIFRAARAFVGGKSNNRFHGAFLLMFRG
jgi:hypothetical protein